VEPSNRRVHALVHGRVQGVRFRASTHEVADRLALSGWVRNLPDGRVEIEVEGTAEAVARLLTWARQGPPGARVAGVDATDVPPTGAAGPFEVRATPRGGA